MKKTIENSRQLRKNMTSQEKKLWSVIRNRQFFGYRFRRQFPLGQHNEIKNIQYDNKRTEYLMAEGYKVIRFWNNDIDRNIGGVYEKLKEVFEIGENITPPQPSPSREGVQ